MRITVLSTYDIWPPGDGGQFHYAELWTKFSGQHEIKIIAYEFRNQVQERRYWLSSNVEVIVAPAEEGDIRHFHWMMEETGLWLHDALCLQDYSFSDAFLRTLAREVRRSDVLVASHPYLAGVAFPLAPRHVMKVYEAHNVEYDVKRRYFATSQARATVSRLLENVRFGEAAAAQQAEHVTAVSETDRLRLIELYDLPAGKVSVVPNGANVARSARMTRDERQQARVQLKVAGVPVGIFIGSAYGPNITSYLRARQMLQEAGFRGTMLMVGSINLAPIASWPKVDFTERWFGFVDEAVKSLLLESADFALQLMFDGAGTNLKLFEYMGSGLPIIANDFGSRGVEEDDWYWPVETSSDLAAALAGLAAEPEEARRRGEEARRIALQRYDWRAIAAGFENGMASGFQRPVDRMAEPTGTERIG